jgi:hypothetical protein
METPALEIEQTQQTQTPIKTQTETERDYTLRVASNVYAALQAVEESDALLSSLTSSPTSITTSTSIASEDLDAIAQCVALARARCERAAVLVDTVLSQQTDIETTELKKTTELTLGLVNLLLHAVSVDCAVLKRASVLLKSSGCVSSRASCADSCAEFDGAACQITHFSFPQLCSCPKQTVERATTKRKRNCKSESTSTSENESESESVPDTHTHLLPQAVDMDSAANLLQTLRRYGFDTNVLSDILVRNNAIISGSEVLFALLSSSLPDVPAYVPSFETRDFSFVGADADADERVRRRHAWKSKDIDFYVLERDAPRFLADLRGMFSDICPKTFASNHSVYSSKEKAEWVDGKQMDEKHVHLSTYFSNATGITAIYRFGNCAEAKKEIPRGSCHCACGHSMGSDYSQCATPKDNQCLCGSSGRFDILDSNDVRFVEVIVLKV